MNKKILLNRKTSIVVIAIVLSIIVLFLLYKKMSDNSLINQSRSFSALPELLNQKSTVPPFMRIKDDLVPATNRWFSSLIFSETQTIYAYPFSYKTDGKGFEVGVPRLTSGENAVFGLHPADISISLSSTSHLVSRYDDISVDNLYKNDKNEDIATVTITQGHPYIYIKGNENTTVAVQPANAEYIEWLEDDKTILFTTNNQRYGITAESITQVEATSFYVNLSKDDSFAVMAIPANTKNVQEYVNSANNPIKSAGIAVEKLADTFETSYTLELEQDKESILGSLPHHNLSQDDSDLGSFDTLYGPLIMHKGKDFKYEHSIRDIPRELNLTAISAEQRENLNAYLTEDTKTLTLNKTDSYFGGKELYRAANLLQLAYQLEERELAKSIQEKLKTALSEWFSPYDGRVNRHFYYDDNLKGVVGVESSFRSEEFNDHHFHYGYFIYAASVLAVHDTDFQSDNKDVVDLLVADIAAPDGLDSFPPLRTYDRFTGHSWASGYGNFADGNNQESSSEATNAWAAIYRWAKITNSAELEKTAQWLYTNEVAATKEYWLKDQREREGFSTFSRPFVSLVWQGKRDFATFFSPRPQAALGIQLIPMSPAHEYLNETDIQKNISSVLENQNSFSGQFGDYLVMYDALSNSNSALVLEQANDVKKNDIDDGNSYSYLYAWLYSQSSNN